MKLLIPPQPGNYKITSCALRTFNALKATAIDASQFPILATHWPGLITVNDSYFCNDNSPLCETYKTAPVNGGADHD